MRHDGVDWIIQIIFYMKKLAKQTSLVKKVAVECAKVASWRNLETRREGNCVSISHQLSEIALTSVNDPSLQSACLFTVKLFAVQRLMPTKFTLPPLVDE